jgi:hypothetical protein
MMLTVFRHMTPCSLQRFGRIIFYIKDGISTFVHNVWQQIAGILIHVILNSWPLTCIYKFGTSVFSDV